MRRLGVDFGDSQTVIAETAGAGERTPASVVSVAPNVINLAEGGDDILQREVLHNGQGDPPATVRHLRHFILKNSPVRIGCGCSTASYQDLGREHLASLIRKAVASGDPDVTELIFSAPPGSPPSFHEWLGSVAVRAEIPAFTVMDEISAAAAGYGIHFNNDLILMVIDIGEEKTEVTIAGLQPPELLWSRVIARTASDLSGTAIDRWIAADILQHYFGNPELPDRAELSPDLLEACRKARLDLTRMDSAEMNLMDRHTGKNHALVFSRQDLEKILRDHHAFTELDRVIAQAIVLGESRGYDKETIEHILVTGKDSQIPSIQAAILLKFGRERVRCNIPSVAVAIGAARHRDGEEGSRTLHRDYALRYWDAGTSQHEYRYIARSGTAYPTRQETARILISAAYDGQMHLGLAIHAFGNGAPERGSKAIELVADTEGRTRCIEQSKDADTVHNTWINESTPTILVAVPPGRKGDVRFELSFRIDSLGILRLDARDVMTGEMILKNHACAALK